MKHKDCILSFADGEKVCVLCDKPLHAHDTWPGARIHTCTGLSCVQDIDSLASSLNSLLRGAKLVRSATEICRGPKCGRFVPARIYGSRSKNFCCSSACWYRRDMNTTALYVCKCGCGKTFAGHRSLSRRRGTAFLNIEHRANFLLEKNLSRCGNLRNVAREYLSTFVPLHYRNPKGAKSSIFPFFHWCAANGIDELNEVRPATITRYLASCRQSGKKTPHYRVSDLSTFFCWAISEERYLAGNPVVSRIHTQKRTMPAPRPLADRDLALMWSLLEKKGDPRLLFAASIAEESGLRIGEICNLRVSDVNLECQEVFVRLPNKSMKERYSLFGAQTAAYCRQLLGDRPQNLSHDHLLWNNVNAPMRIESLRRFLCLALCKSYKGKVLQETGFERWSTHRLRHNMATSMRRGGADMAALLSIGGWQSMDAAGSYIDLNGDDSKSEYAAAMDRARKARNQHQLVESETLTPSQLLEKSLRQMKNETAHN